VRKRRKAETFRRMVRTMINFPSARTPDVAAPSAHHPGGEGDTNADDTILTPNHYYREGILASQRDRK